MRNFQKQIAEIDRTITASISAKEYLAEVETKKSGQGAGSVPASDDFALKEPTGFPSISVF